MVASRMTISAKILAEVASASRPMIAAVPARPRMAPTNLKSVAGSCRVMPQVIRKAKIGVVEASTTVFAARHILLRPGDQQERKRRIDGLLLGEQLPGPGPACPPEALPLRGAGCAAAAAWPSHHWKAVYGYCGCPCSSALPAPAHGPPTSGPGPSTRPAGPASFPPKPPRPRGLLHTRLGFLLGST